MTKAEIIAELSTLQPDELAEVRAKLDELTGVGWLPDSGLTDADKADLEVGVQKLLKNPNGGSSWAEVEARFKARFG